jgi:hypothetical protein
LSELSASRLNHLKSLAQSPREHSATLAQITLGGHLFEVSGNGRHPYAFVLTSPFYRLEIAKLGAKNLPMVYCQIASELLSMMPTDKIIKNLHAIVGELGTAVGAANVSRCDPCVDFVTDYPIESIRNDEWVTKARNFSSHITDRVFSGISIGAGSPLSARLYNKTIEMKKNARPYLEDIWRQGGWDGVSEVWRLEFQYRRQPLRDVLVVTYADLMTSLSGLWGYSATKWLRHTSPSDSDKTQSRWPLSSLWQTLSEADWQGEKHLARTNLQPSKAPSDQFLFVNSLGFLSSFMAREGYVDAGEAILQYFQAAQDHHNENAATSGEDFDTYINLKVAQKCKAYGTTRNSPIGGGPHPDDRIKARAYRRLSDGE